MPFSHLLLLQSILLLLVQICVHPKVGFVFKDRPSIYGIKSLSFDSFFKKSLGLILKGDNLGIFFLKKKNRFGININLYKRNHASFQ
jgi:hypothetical protein